MEQIHVTTITNPCSNFDKSLEYLREIRVSNLINPYNNYQEKSMYINFDVKYVGILQCDDEDEECGHPAVHSAALRSLSKGLNFRQGWHCASAGAGDAASQEY